MINIVTIFGGCDKYGNPEKINEICIERGEIIGVVGPTGSGKSSLIADIEQLAQRDTPTKRMLLPAGHHQTCVSIRYSP